MATDPRAAPPFEEVLVAPWSAEQVDQLNIYQRRGSFHEFTCGNQHGGDKTLFATVDGWRCPHCDYQQRWAHGFMADPAMNTFDVHLKGRSQGEPFQSPLRDLILRIDAVAQPHLAFPQACAALGHLRDHLSALAFCEETNRRAAGIAPTPVYKR